MTENQLLTQVGKRIKEIRLEKGLTQVELADLCDFDKSNMARIEAGGNNLTLTTLLKISKALKVDISYLFESA